MEKETTIVAFKIGRGGRFHNAGHRTFLGERPISYFTGDLFTRFENEQKCLSEIADDGSSIDLAMDFIADGNFVELENQFGITKEMLGEEEYYCGASLSSVGLTVEECNRGVGCIDIDGDYNTVYCKYLEDCTEDEIATIRDSGEWNALELVEEWKSAQKED